MFLAEPPKPEDLITTVPEVLLEKDLGEILTALEFKRELVSIFSQMVIEPPVMITTEGGSASGKNKLALGLSESLDDFALKNGASTWKDFPDPTNWKNGVLDALYDSNTEIIVNLDGVDNPLSSIQRVAVGYGGATDWELLQIKLTPESWDRITWYKDGNVVPNPFEY